MPLSTPTPLPTHAPRAAADGPTEAVDELAAQTDGFYDALTGLLRLYMLRDRSRVCTHGMSVTECYALDALVRLGPLNVTRLADELGVNKSTASRVAGSLQTKGLVDGVEDPVDYKAKLLRPTDAGLERNAAVVADVKAEHRSLLSGFTPAARAEATRLLRAVTAAAAPRIRANGSACCEGTKPG